MYGSWAEFHLRHDVKAESAEPGIIGVHCSPAHAVADDSTRKNCADCMGTFREWVSRNQLGVVGSMSVAEAGRLMAAR